MNRLVEENKIQVLQCGNNFAYILTNDSYFAMTDYKVLQSQINGNFVSCMKMLYNGSIELFYKVDEYKSLDSLIRNITPEIFMTIVSNLFTDIIEVRNNGFLSCQNVDISWDKVFIDTNTLKVKLVYMPLTIRAYDDYLSFENEVRVELIKLINENANLRSNKVIQLVAGLSNGRLSLEDLYNKMKGNTISSKSIVASQISSNSSFIKIVAINAPDHFEIIVDKDEMVIGKKPELVDVLISFNKMISRIHCKIIRSNGSYYILDLDSANGTYVNNRRIAPNKLWQIKHGDIIRLANSEFQVV